MEQSNGRNVGILTGTDGASRTGVLQAPFHPVSGQNLPVWLLNHGCILLPEQSLSSLGLSLPVRRFVENMHPVCSVCWCIYRTSLLKRPTIFKIILFSIPRAAVSSFCATFDWKVILHSFYSILCSQLRVALDCWRRKQAFTRWCCFRSSCYFCLPKC